MSQVIVIEFVSLDGVMQDPDGNEGSRNGGWAFRYGPEAVSGDPFGLSEVLQTGALLLGRRTWQMFAGIWPGRDDPFSAQMNAMPKLVMSRSLEHADGWQNSALLRGDLATEAGKRKAEQDIVVMGSASVVRTLMAHDLADEYRLPHCRTSRREPPCPLRPPRTCPAGCIERPRDLQLTARPRSAPLQR